MSDRVMEPWAAGQLIQSTLGRGGVNTRGVSGSLLGSWMSLDATDRAGCLSLFVLSDWSVLVERQEDNN